MNQLGNLFSCGQSFIVFDLELTAWEGSLESNWSRPGEFREIVQIGAVRLGSDLSETAAFSQYVRPTRNPILSAYFIDLTGIDQKMIDRLGVDLASALDLFARFIDDSRSVVSNGPDGDVLLENCRLNNLTCPVSVSLFKNIRSDISGALSVSDDKADSYRLPSIAGLTIQARAHDALNDARCVAAALRRIAEDIIY